MSKENKLFIVDIDFSPIEIRVIAKNRTEARKKALARLKNKNPLNLIKREWPSNKKDISVDEF